MKKLGFSCIGNAVDWHNETVQLADGEEGETKTVLVPRVTIVPMADLEKATLDAIAEVSQQANGALRVKMHDKHAALVSLGKHLGLFTERANQGRVRHSRQADDRRGVEEAIREAGVMFARAKPAGVAASSGATAGADAVSSTMAVRKHEAGFNRM